MFELHNYGGDGDVRDTQYVVIVPRLTSSLPFQRS
jgi:hypothetical protein